MRTVIFIRVFALAVSLAVSVFTGVCFAAERTVTLLHINDVYEIETQRDGKGGMTRLKTVVDRERAADPEALFILSGDFLSPSLMSGVFHGRQMIDALNAVGLDYATLGNHEFDFGQTALAKRLDEAVFTVVISNLKKRGAQYPGTIPYAVRDVNGVTVGLFGLLTPETRRLANLPRSIAITDVSQAAKETIRALKEQGAEIIVAVTHLHMHRDLFLAASVPGIDVILGGHDHIAAVEKVGKTLVVKSGANAKILDKVVIIVDDSLKTVTQTQIGIDDTVPEDPIMAALVAGYKQRLDADLNVVIGRSAVALDATEASVRSKEANLGDFITDVMRTAMKTDVAFLNGGAIRTDMTYGPGDITKKDVYSILPFGDILCSIRVSGRTIMGALEKAAQQVAKGGFLQMSGVTFTANLTAQPAAITGVSVNGKALDPKAEYTVALTDYLLRGGDGYGMFKKAPVITGPEYGSKLADTVVNAILKRKEIHPSVVGRITLKR